MSTIYVGPKATGNGSGSSASNTLSIGSLDKAIQLAGAGGTVVLLSDQGVYNVTSTINLSHGGAAGAAVTIVGQDSSGHLSNVVINGSRPATYTAGMSSGNVLFRMTTGANELNFDHITVSNVGSAFLAAYDVNDISISNMTANNVGYFFNDYASVSGGTASVSNLVISDVNVHGFSKGVIRLQYDSHDIAISNVYGDSQREDGDGIAMGVHFAGTAHDITVTGSTMENSIATSATYWNGDGFTAEAGVYNLTFRDDVSRGNADAGFDIKAAGTTLINCTAVDNGRNFRLWSDVTLINTTGLDPHKQGGTTGGQEQIQVLHGAHITVTGGAFADSGSSSKVVLFDAGGSITFTDTRIVHAGPLQGSSGTLTIDPANVQTVAATGAWSTNGASLLGQTEEAADRAPSGATFTGGTIAENSAAGTLVGTVHGIDPDAGDTLTYALSDDAGGRFAIDAGTGAVTVASGAALDYETQSSFALKAVVTDSHGLTYTAPLTVTLTDVAETSSKGNGGGNGRKVFHFSGSDHTALVSNPGLSSGPSSQPTAAANAPSGSMLHLYASEDSWSGRYPVHAPAGAAHLEVRENGPAASPGSAASFASYEDMHLVGGLHPHASEFLF